MSLSRKRKKELRKLQAQANNLWESQQVLVGEAANVAREASRQLGHLNREQVDPRCSGDAMASTPRPYVDKGMQFSKQVLNDKVVPTAGAVVGSALSVWDAANDTRAQLAAGRDSRCPTRPSMRRRPTSTAHRRRSGWRRSSPCSTRPSRASAPVA